MSSGESISSQRKFELITRDIEETLGGDALLKILEENERPLKCYWGTAPTGRPHVGYLVPLTKLADFLRAGVEVKVLLADIHAFLDNMKAPIELVKQRAEYYKSILIAVMKAIGVPVDRLIFVLGSSYQLSEKYNFDTYRLAAMVTEHDAKKAGAEVVKQVASPLLSGLLYPGLQALDEQFLDVDVQFGGIDQRKIFTFAEQYLPKLGYKKRSHLMNAMVPGMNGAKMSSSDLDSKIDFLDKPTDIKRKIKGAYCMPGELENNGVIAFVGSVLMPIVRVRYDTLEMGITPDQHWVRPLVPSDAPEGTLFSVIRPEKYGGTLHYNDYEQLKKDFVDQKIHPQDLKSAVTDAIIALLQPVHEMHETDEQFRKTKALAYPEDEPKETKKKVKKGGLAETEEEAAANAAAAGVPYKPSRKSKKQDSSSNEPSGTLPGALAENTELNPPPSLADLQIE
ncbi:tyrosine--tRNA ligase [Malassezia yamatoensis]|uniref:Tyrosine--tRNA ligase n=1 Tax=Malassezia yamatoensis TaxID=253288 RepID=A0AAJ6CGD1_9BASI|nr:tyrosine--tRNA ligase [Malassezia yamatoensis]